MARPIHLALRPILLLAAAVVLVVPGAMSAQTGSASFGGAILSDPAEKPLANAEITFVKLGVTARSDSAGNFVIRGLPAGRHEIAIRLVGYEPLITTVAFDPGEKIEGDFLLKAATTTLANVETKATTTAGMSPAMIDFEARRKRGTGRFLTQDVLQDQQNRLMSDILTRQFPGIHANSLNGNGKAMATGRSTISISEGANSLDKWDRAQGIKEDCYLQILLDGIVMYQAVPGRPLFDINSISPASLAGVEFYQASQTPAQFQATGAQCGTIAIWTRAR